MNIETSENKKAFKKFLLILCVWGMFGGLSGFIMTSAEDVIKDIPKYLNSALIYILPYSICVTGVLLFIVTFMFYKKSKKLYERCDAEDEKLINKAEYINGCSMIINSINLIITFFFFGTGVILDEHVFDLDKNLYNFIIFLFSFFINTAVIIGMQQKQVDFEKIINPEKKGSVYDYKFAEKWEESCDERERFMIYKSAYKAYKATNMTCILIWMILILMNLAWNTGIMSIVVVTIIWAVLIISYLVEAMRAQR